MAYDVRAIANLVLRAGSQNGISITNLSLNKILYFLHAWYLAKTGRPLVNAKIEAWNYGPVFREIYSEFKALGERPIESLATRRNPKTAEVEICEVAITDEDLGFIRPVLDKYIKMSAYQLVSLSHEEGGPWDVVYNHDGGSNPGMRISDEIIRQHFSQQTRH